jgi:hypothetical protein
MSPDAGAAEPTARGGRIESGDGTWRSSSRRTSEQSQLSWEELSGQGSQSGFKDQQARYYDDSVANDHHDHEFES